MTELKDPNSGATEKEKIDKQKILQIEVLGTSCGQYVPIHERWVLFFDKVLNKLKSEENEPLTAKMQLSECVHPIEKSTRIPRAKELTDHC